MLLVLLYINLKKSINDLSHASTVAVIIIIFHCGHEEVACHTTTIEPPLCGLMRSISIPSQSRLLPLHPVSPWKVEVRPTHRCKRPRREGRGWSCPLSQTDAPSQCQSPRQQSTLPILFCCCLLLFNWQMNCMYLFVWSMIFCSIYPLWNG